jgi:lipoprotein-anchoring transpeptidase ErfK/SrfK
MRRSGGIERRHQAGRRRRGGATVVASAVPALALVLALLASGCSASLSPDSGPPSSSPSPSPTLSAAHITITPKNGLRQAKPQRGITVTVRDGTLVSVTARSAGAPIAGEMDVTATSWRSRWALPTGRQYVVRATARDAEGRTVTKMSRFRTLTPHTTASIQIFQGHNVTYGVGMPVMLAFSRPVEDKKAVERAIVLTSSRPTVGAWYWDGDQALWFRPRAYWPQHTRVSFAGHFDGVQLSPGVYATHTLRQDFKIGRSLIVVASAGEHRMKVFKDRKLFATWPISTGKPGKETPNGAYLSIEKANPQHMVGDDYDIQVPHSVRFTWSGDFIHAAPWSVGSQGYANVSHGCVNLAPERARAYYEMSLPGDPITVTGSPKAGKWDDGWTVWFLSWKRLVNGGALRKAVRVGPDGSTWVRPSVLKPSKAKAPLGRPKPDSAAPS